MSIGSSQLGKLGTLIRQGFDPDDVAIIATRVAANIEQDDLAYLAGPIMHGEGIPPAWLVEQARVQRYRIVGGELPEYPCTAAEIVLILGWQARVELGDPFATELLLWARELAERHRRDLPCRQLERRADVVGDHGRLNETFWNYGSAVRRLVQEGGEARALDLCEHRLRARALM